MIPQRLEEQLAVQALLAEYGGLLDLGRYDDWLALFAAECRYEVVPRENHDAGLPVALILCDNRAMLEDRIAALRQANKYNLHTDRHIIGLPRIIATDPGLIDARIDPRIDVEAPFAVYQTNQEGETILFATGLYRHRLERSVPNTAWRRCAWPKRWSCSTRSRSRHCSRRRSERTRSCLTGRSSRPCYRRPRHRRPRHRHPGHRRAGRRRGGRVS